MAELEASPFWPQPNGAAEPVTKPPTEPDDQADAEPDIAEYDDLDQAQRLDLLASTEPPPEWDEVDDDHAAAS
ncbi:hypothetical protein AB0I34_06905 [Kribbella sp. NPDC050281]|uniref:hypothetical protein n=1 Tax=Kribbella sp. NPDC050281 TaxID=3155515 RepID=UPI0033EB1A62